MEDRIIDSLFKYLVRTRPKISNGGDWNQPNEEWIPLVQAFLNTIIGRPCDSDSKAREQAKPTKKRKKLRFQEPIVTPAILISSSTSHPEAEARPRKSLDPRMSLFTFTFKASDFPSGSFNLTWPRDIPHYSCIAPMKSLFYALRDLVPHLDWNAPSSIFSPDDLNLTGQVVEAALNCYTIHKLCMWLENDFEIARKHVSRFYAATEQLAVHLKKMGSGFNWNIGDLVEKLEADGWKEDIEGWETHVQELVRLDKKMESARLQLVVMLRKVRKKTQIVLKGVADMTKLLERLLQKVKRQRSPLSTIQAEVDPEKIKKFYKFSSEVQKHMEAVVKGLIADRTELAGAPQLIGETLRPEDMVFKFEKMCYHILPLIKRTGDKYRVTPKGKFAEDLKKEMEVIYKVLVLQAKWRFNMVP